MLVINRNPAFVGDNKQPHTDSRRSRITLLNRSEHDLTITLRPGEQLGVIHILESTDHRVRVGLELPEDLAIMRQEKCEETAGVL